jgi:hypothetical protein
MVICTTILRGVVGSVEDAMSYYDTIDEDLQRAKEILQEGRLKDEDVPQHLSSDLRMHLIAQSGTIFGKDTYAAYKLLESFVEEIERLRGPRGER